MTAKQMSPAIGQTVFVRCENLRVACIVTDVKHVYGKARLEVMPVAGDGLMWVEMSRIIGVPDRWEWAAGPCVPYRSQEVANA